MNMQNMIVASYHIILPSQAMTTSITMFTEKIMQSRAIGNQFSWTGLMEASPAQAATPSVLNSIEPMMVPSPISDSVRNVLIVLVKNSGVAPANAMNVQAATSCNNNKNKSVMVIKLEPRIAVIMRTSNHNLM